MRVQVCAKFPEGWQGLHLHEDKGEGILFHVFVYNVQPGIVINYADGSSGVGEAVTQATVVETNYILNINTDKFHYPDCRSVKQMKAKNRREYTGTREELIAQGYAPCGNCHP